MSNTVYCTQCGLANSVSSKFCVNCGTPLRISAGNPTTAKEYSKRVYDLPIPDHEEITYSPSRTNNYQAIRSISLLFKSLSWVFIGLTALTFIGLLVSYGESSGSNMDIGFYFFITAIFSNLLMAAVFALFSEGINVIIDTEANTRQTAKTLERILRSQNFG